MSRVHIITAFRADPDHLVVSFCDTGIDDDSKTGVSFSVSDYVRKYKLQKKFAKRLTISNYDIEMPWSWSNGNGLSFKMDESTNRYSCMPIEQVREAWEYLQEKKGFEVYGVTQGA